MIQGDISELTVDAVVHPTNSSFSLSGQCGRWYFKERGGGGREGERVGEGKREREREAVVIVF